MGGGSLLDSILTLFKTVTGGIDWADVLGSLEVIGDVWVAVFVVFIAFAQFALLNIITGVVCTTAIEATNNDQDMVMQAHLLRKKKYVKALTDVFDQIDESGTGFITF